ncbi:MAG: TIM barrel protein [Burkholderiaceae bacterium]|nr:TIM barrel protein [Burkholderiaceae bacterium]
MPRFAANLSLMYPEHALRDRVAAAASDGFAAVEVQAPYAVPAAELRAALADARVQLVLMNAPQGDYDAGERGLAALPGRERDFEAAIAQALEYARGVGAPRVHVLAGIPGAVPAAECERVYRRNLAYACDVFAPHGIEVMIEPINTRDMPGYFLHRLQHAARTIEAVARPNLRLQFDCYHVQIMEGDLTHRLREHVGLVGHVQIAGVPQRHEPDLGEVNYPFVFAQLDALGYRGWVGCEYRPAAGSRPGGTRAGLAWLRRI